MCKRYNMHANKVKKYVLSNYLASTFHLKTVGGLTHSMCLIHWGLQGIYTRLLLIMKLISVYLEYIAVSEYTHEQNSLVKRNHFNLIHEKERPKKVTCFWGKKNRKNHPDPAFTLCWDKANENLAASSRICFCPCQVGSRCLALFHSFYFLVRKCNPRFSLMKWMWRKREFCFVLILIASYLPWSKSILTSKRNEVINDLFCKNKWTIKQPHRRYTSV